MAYRYYLDEDMPAQAAEIGRRLGLDAVSAYEVGPVPRPDPVHLAAAAAEGRILVTYNRNDFLAATAAAYTKGARHAGVIILTHRLPREGARIAHALKRFDELAQAAYGVPLQPYQIVFLSD